MNHVTTKPTVAAKIAAVVIHPSTFNQNVLTSSSGERFGVATI
jgi:hypothetical protein